MARLGRRVRDEHGGRRPDTRERAGLELVRPERADALLAAVVTLAALGLYARTACRTIFAGDSAELAAAAAVFGVPHPPGYPLYTPLTGLLMRALPVGDLAFAANLTSALYAALAVGLAWLFFRRVGAGRAAATCGAATLALGASFWSQATAAEVYGFDALLLFVVLHAAIGVARREERGAWLLFGVALGLWLGHRAVNALLLPGILALLVARGAFRAGGARAAGRALLRSAAGAGLALLVFLYLPLSSARDPGLDVGDPETLGRFLAVVGNEPYRRHLVGPAAAFASNRPLRFVTGLPRELGLGLLLAAAGAVLALRRPGGRALVAAAGLIVAANALFGFHYAVLDVDAFYLPSWAALALLAALGAEELLSRAGRRRALLAPALVVLGLAALPWNWTRSDRSGDRTTRLLAEDVLASTGEAGALFVSGDAGAHSLWFLQEVEGRAPGLVVVSLGHLREWYVDQLRARHPEVEWPPFAEDDPRAFLSGAVDALIERGPVYVSLSADPAAIGASGARGDRYGTLIRGVVREVVPVGEHEVRTRATWTSDFLDAAVRRLRAVTREPDLDAKSTLLKYALALFQNAELLAGLGDVERATRDLEHVVSLDPDRHERDVARDVLEGLGQELPFQGLGARAEHALAELRAR